jgi:hypothetical protein
MNSVRNKRKYMIRVFMPNGKMTMDVFPNKDDAEAMVQIINFSRKTTGCWARFEGVAK